MKRLILPAMILFWALLWVQTSFAEVKYVSDIINITMRTGPGIDHKVIAMIRTGQKVEVLESSDNWSKIKLPNDKEGWVLNRYLRSDKPREVEYESLENNYKELVSQADQLKKENDKMKSENIDLKSRLETSEKKLAETLEAFESIKQLSNFDEIEKNRSDYEKLKIQYERQKRFADNLENELNEIKRDKKLKWFLSGAGVVVFGILIGIGFGGRRSRRRSTYI